MWTKIPNLIEKSWWGPPVAYLALFWLFYGIIWAAIEPLHIPENICQSAPQWLFDRSFYHIAAALFFASNALIVYFSIRNRKREQMKPVQPMEPTKSLEPVEITSRELKDITENSLSLKEEMGEVDMDLLSNTDIVISYSVPFISKPRLDITINSPLGNRPIVSSETKKGFKLSRPNFWAQSSSHTIVKWKAIGLRKI